MVEVFWVAMFSYLAFRKYTEYKIAKLDSERTTTTTVYEYESNEEI